MPVDADDDVDVRREAGDRGVEPVRRAPGGVGDDPHPRVRRREAVRDLGLLIGAVERPALKYRGMDVYTPLAMKAAAFMESLARNNSLFDGNKRLAWLATNVFLELNGATVCLLPGTTSEQNVADYFRANRMTFQPVVIESAAEIQGAFLSGRCDVYSNDRTDMTGIRAAQGARADELVILPEVISKEPLGPLVRKNDGRWFDVVRWTHFALVAAEELGITQANVEQMRASANPEIRRLLGVEGDFGRQIGLDNGWAAAAIKAVGNYGEVWDRNQKPLGADRGLNRLWKDGGLQYAPPFR